MSGIFGSLNLGLSALQSFMTLIEVAGNNIANVETDGYSRQRAELVQTDPVTIGGLTIGTGVKINRVVRVHDDYLDGVIRRESSILHELDVLESYYQRAEDVLLEPSESGINSLLADFYAAFDEVAASPEETPARATAVGTGLTLAEGISFVRDQLYNLQTTANEEIAVRVAQFNSYLHRVAELNAKIVDGELEGQPANDFRDQRDQILQKLGDLAHVTVTQLDNGAVNVAVSGWVVVNETTVHELAVEHDDAAGLDRPDLYKIVYAETGDRVNVQHGELQGLMQARDDLLGSFIEQLDQTAAAIIHNVNLLHATGVGLAGLSTTTAAIGVDDINAALDSEAAGLSFDVQSGTITVSILDDSGTVVAVHQIDVDLDGAGSDTTLQSLADAFNATGDLSASIDATGKLTISATGGHTFAFNGDTSGVLAALEVNSFFTGTDASNIDLNPQVRDAVNLLAVGRLEAEVGATIAPGDNSVALEIAALRDRPVMNGGTTTIAGFYQTAVSTMAIDGNRVKQSKEGQDLFVTGLEARRDEISGVNLDEEMANLVRFQRSYEAAAQFIRLIDRMLEEMVNLVQ